MKEHIPALIALCNKQIVKWYRQCSPKDLCDFTPVDKNDADVVDMIYEMYLLLNKNGMVQLYTVVKYYFALNVVETYVLDNWCPVFTGRTANKMVEFSKNNEISGLRRKIMGFNTNPYVHRRIPTPYLFSIPGTKA